MAKEEFGMPLGLGMAIAQDTRAMDGFFSLDDRQKIELVDYIQSAQTGEEAKSRIESTVQMLHDGNISEKFF